MTYSEYCSRDHRFNLLIDSKRFSSSTYPRRRPGNKEVVMSALAAVHRSRFGLGRGSDVKMLTM